MFSLCASFPEKDYIIKYIEKQLFPILPVFLYFLEPFSAANIVYLFTGAIGTDARFDAGKS